MRLNGMWKRLFRAAQGKMEQIEQDQEPAPRRTPAKKRLFEYGGVTMQAYTRSEARALFKKKSGVGPKGRLPVGSLIEEVLV
jgi:hypothetical protein